MLRVSKLADYGIVLMAYRAGDADRQPVTARQLAEESDLPLPTVGKILKSLARSGLLVSHRGGHGGYSVARPNEKISVADMITAIDGPIALTECSSNVTELCDIESSCPVRKNWQVISQVVREALEQLTLADMRRPRPECVARVCPSKAGGRRPTPMLTLVRGTA